MSTANRRAATPWDESSHGAPFFSDVMLCLKIAPVLMNLMFGQMLKLLILFCVFFSKTLEILVDTLEIW